MNKKKKTTLFIVGILLVISIITGISYALWGITRVQTNPNEISSGCFSLEMIDGETLELSNAYPITEEQAMKKEGYTFQLKNTCTIDAKVNIKLLIMNDSTMALNHVKSNLNGDVVIPSKMLSSMENGTTTTSNVTSTKVMGTIYVPGNTTKEYELRLWLNENVTTEEEGNTILNAKVEVEATTAMVYADASGANAPELNNGLIPVVYNEDKSSWEVANLYSEWYNYTEQKWANAVTVKEANRSTYVTATAGTEIPMSEINTMWVWIPRYEYSIYTTDGTTSTTYYGKTLDGVGVTDKTLPGAIDINFISQDTTTASVGNFIIHPAFIFGTQQLSGMWVAKFEMSPAVGTTCATTPNITNCDVITFAPEIKPNVSSWRNTRVGTFFTAIQNQMNGSNGTTTYGITNSDTHMMKNMEWGAVAYLSQSKYGKYGNTTYTGANKEIYQNKSSDYITGNSNGTPSQDITNTQVVYNVEGTGTGASTTGTIYGIYDMSGGAWEYVMGVMKDTTNTEPMIGYTTGSNSGFSGKLYNGTLYTRTYKALKDIDAKYYDTYDYGTAQNGIAVYQRVHQGDGTTEVVLWYKDSGVFVYSSRSWFVRGGYYSGVSGAGIFNFNSITGAASTGFSARAVLVAAE